MSIPRLTGWCRLFVVLSIIYGLGCAAIVYEEVRSARLEEVAYELRHLDVITKSKTAQEVAFSVRALQDLAQARRERQRSAIWRFFMYWASALAGTVSIVAIGLWVARGFKATT